MKENTSRINADIPKDMHIKLRVRAAETGKSIREILTDSIAAYLRGEVSHAK